TGRLECTRLLEVENWARGGSERLRDEILAAWDLHPLGGVSRAAPSVVAAPGEAVSDGAAAAEIARLAAELRSVEDRLRGAQNELLGSRDEVLRAQDEMRSELENARAQ